MIIGIGGVSRSGKSSLAQWLSREFKDSISLSLDDFAYPRHKLPKVNGLYDWEVPPAYNFDRLLQTTKKMHQLHAVVIVEGILVFHDHRLNDLFDRRILLQIDRNEFLERRTKETRWGNEPRWYLDYTWESYQRHGSQCKGDHVVLSGLKPFPTTGLNRWIETGEPADLILLK